MSEDRSVHELIDAVPWARLGDAYGFALDAPLMLHGQVGATELDHNFYNWVFSSIIHQGTPYSATAPALWLLHRIVDADPRHPALEACLGAVAEYATALLWVENHWEEAKGLRTQRDWHISPEGDPPWATAIPPGYDTPPKVDGTVHDDYFVAAAPHLDSMQTCLAAWQPTVIRCLRERAHLDDALEAASALVALSPNGPTAEELASVAADRDATPHHRAAAIYALARSNSRVTPHIHSDNRAFRLALALGQPDRAGSLDALVDALDDLDWLITAFPRELPGEHRSLIAAVTSAVLHQSNISDESDTIISALAGVVARPSGPFGATYEWGPILAWAFPDRVQTGTVKTVPPPDSITHPQAVLLRALLTNNQAWTPKSGNDSLALRTVGLPHNRAAVAKLVSLHHPGGTPPRWWQRRSATKSD